MQLLDYMELQCCLSQFQSPNLMDIKIGTRTFLEDEVGFSPKQFESKKSVKATVCKPRRDLYEKMVKEDPEAPTTEETSDEAVSKYRCAPLFPFSIQTRIPVIIFRYMDWRDCISSTRTLGFR